MVRAYTDRENSSSRSKSRREREREWKRRHVQNCLWFIWQQGGAGMFRHGPCSRSGTRWHHQQYWYSRSCSRVVILLSLLSVYTLLSCPPRSLCVCECKRTPGAHNWPMKGTYGPQRMRWVGCRKQLGEARCGLVPAVPAALHCCAIVLICHRCSTTMGWFSPWGLII